MSISYLLQAAQPSAQGSLLSMLLPFGLIFIVFYFFIIRPQKKQQKETQRMLDAMKKGDKVVTIGGIHGTIHQTKEKTVIVKVDDNTKLEFTRTAIATVTPLETKSAEKTEAVAEEKPAKAKRGKKAKETIEEVKTTDTEVPVEASENASEATE